MQPDGTGLCHDKGKARFDLLPAIPLAVVAQVFTAGVESGKYEDRNWEKGTRWGKQYAAAQRHMWAFWAGSDVDSESNLLQLAHAVARCLMLMEYMRTFREGDDRPTPPQPPRHEPGEEHGYPAGVDVLLPPPTLTEAARVANRFQEAYRSKAEAIALHDRLIQRDPAEDAGPSPSSKHGRSESSA